MIKLKHFLYFYNLAFLILLMIIGAVIGKGFFVSAAFGFIVLPLMLYFGGYLFLTKGRVRQESGQYFWVMVIVLMIYNLLATGLLLGINVVLARSWMDWMISLLYLPFPLYFSLTIYHWYRKAQVDALAVKKQKAKLSAMEGKTEVEVGVVDNDRRKFLKLLGGAGIAMFAMSLLNPKQAGAAFFGSVPGPGTVAIKDAAGNKINPAEKQPTDGYKISQIDDAAFPHYFGCVNNAGAWYIMREDSSLAYRYAKGSTDFSTNWTNRASLTYDYFDAVF